MSVTDGATSVMPLFTQHGQTWKLGGDLQKRTQNYPLWHIATPSMTSKECLQDVWTGARVVHVFFVTVSVLRLALK